jgi:hypothetical protein
MYEHGYRRTLLDDQQLPTQVLWHVAFVLGAQFDTVRTSRLLFHPPQTPRCVFLHLRTHPQILRMMPHRKRHVDFSIMGLLLIFDILYVPLALITGLTSLSDDLGIPFDVIHCSVGYFFTPSES